MRVLQRVDVRRLVETAFEQVVNKGCRESQAKRGALEK